MRKAAHEGSAPQHAGSMHEGPKPQHAGTMATREGPMPQHELPNLASRALYVAHPTACSRPGEEEDEELCIERQAGHQKGDG